MGYNDSKRFDEVFAAELARLRPQLTVAPPNAFSSQEERLQSIYRAMASPDRRLHEAGCQLSALCLSGGGLRSASFNLGVLQALARIGVLQKFDYLSGVGGGACLAAWFTAWTSRQGAASVMQELAGTDAGRRATFSPEPEAISKLRSLSRLVYPDLGLFAGTTWAAAAKCVRNLLAIWMVILPTLATAVGIPMLYLLVINTKTDAISGSVLVSAALAAQCIASLLVYRCRRVAKKPNLTQSYFLALCVLPVCSAALLLSVSAVNIDIPWRADSPRPSAIQLQKLWEFAAIWCIAMPLLGWLLAELLMRYSPQSNDASADRARTIQQEQIERRQVSMTMEMFAVLISGGISAYLFVAVVTHFFSYLYDHPAVYGLLVFPLLLGQFVLSTIIFMLVAGLEIELRSRIPDDSRNRVSSNDADQEWWSRLSGWLLLIMVAWLSVVAICLFESLLPNVISTHFNLTQYSVEDIWKWLVSAVGAISGTIAALFGSSARTSAFASAPRPLSIRAMLVAGPVFLFCLVTLLSWLIKAIVLQTIGPEALLAFGFERPPQALPVLDTVSFAAIIASLGLLAAITSRIVNINRFSLHAIYRNQFGRSFLAAANIKVNGHSKRFPDPFTGYSLSDDMGLHALYPKERSPESKVPLLIINATVNLSSEKTQALQERTVASFSMTPLFCGSWPLGYRASDAYGGPEGISVGTAATISGVAGNRNVGYSSSAILSFVMSMFNVRLSAWLGNPNSRGDKVRAHTGPHNVIPPLLAELFGVSNTRRKYVNLSDGGHFDNLALYETVLRRCRLIVVSDASQDGTFSFDDMANAIRRIRTDLGINLVLEKVQIIPPGLHREGLYCVFGRIRYSDVDFTPPEEDGLLICIKPTLCGRGPALPYDVYSFARSHAWFPHETVAGESFSDPQFESYRVLGVHTIESMVADRPLTENPNLMDFFESARAYVDSAREANG